MHKDGDLPGKAVEGGIELFSRTNELDLIRTWLQEAPAGVRIIRVSHNRRHEEDSFTISCVFEPATVMKNKADGDRVRRLWDEHIEPLDLPALTWIGSREIRLDWYPQGLEPRYVDEVPACERVEFDFQLEADQAICLWRMLQGHESKMLGHLFTDFDDALANIGNLEPFESAEGLQLSAKQLEASIYDWPDIWFCVLIQASKVGIRSPLLHEFPVACDRLREHGLPDLSHLSSAWESLPENVEFACDKPADQELCSEMFWLGVNALDAILSPNLKQVNELIRLIQEQEAEDVEGAEE